MAEKEERILSIETDEKIVECGYGDFYNTISKKEAIDRMAKAICKFEMMSARNVCKECSAECFEHLELEVVDKAEAALKALLGEKE